MLLKRVYLEYILCLTQWSTIAQCRCVLPAGSQQFGNIIALGEWCNCRNQVKLEGRVCHRAWHQPWLSRWPVCFFKSRGLCVSNMVLQNQSGQYHVINLLKAEVVLVQSEILNERNTRGLKGKTDSIWRVWGGTGSGAKVSKIPLNKSYRRVFLWKT